MNKTANYQFTIAIPVFNEEGNLNSYKTSKVLARIKRMPGCISDAACHS